MLNLLLIFFTPAFAQVEICEDFECLSKNSLEQYQKNHVQWWHVYNDTAGPALHCESIEAVRQFLLLWSGEVDGEMAEAYYEHTDIILDDHTSCFFTALNSSSSEVQADFVNKWCPFLNFGLSEKIESYLVLNPNDKLAVRALQRIKTKQCKTWL